MKTQEMLTTHPVKPKMEQRELIACIEACLACADACTLCADACLSEKNLPALTKCIRSNLDCADICQATAKLLARHRDMNVQLLRAQLQTTVLAAGICADQCEPHGEMHQHCRICASVCRNCVGSCQRVLSGLPKNA
ncbi:hypothetical protein GMSM_08610 [Geomonas sp. Red276]